MAAVFRDQINHECTILFDNNQFWPSHQIVVNSTYSSSNDWLGDIIQDLFGILEDANSSYGDKRRSVLVDNTVV